jgi:hypothetical protein
VFGRVKDKGPPGIMRTAAGPQLKQARQGLFGG